MVIVKVMIKGQYIIRLVLLLLVFNGSALLFVALNYMFKYDVKIKGFINNQGLKQRFFPEDIILFQDNQSSHHLAVLIPYRDAENDLRQLVPHLNRFLGRRQITHSFYVIQQCDFHRFNRAALTNIGFLEATEEFDYIVIHDVDMLPLHYNLDYTYPQETGIHHMTPAGIHPKYLYKHFFGGIIVTTKDVYKKINGMSTMYWGWGKEDDELKLRIMYHKINVTTPHGVPKDQTAFLHIHNATKRFRDRKNYFGQNKISFRFMSGTGLNTTNYKVLKKHIVYIDHIPVTFIDVVLICNIDCTPWCVSTEKYHNVTMYLRYKNFTKPVDIDNFTMKEVERLILYKAKKTKKDHGDIHNKMLKQKT